MNKPIRLLEFFPINIACTALAIAFLIPNVSSAQRVAITNFIGGSSKTLNPKGDKLLADRLEVEGVEVVRWDEYRAAADDAGFGPGTKKNAPAIESVSTNINLNAVIIGKAGWKPKARKTSLKISIYSAMGEKLASNAYTFKGKVKLPAAILDTIWKDIEAVFSEHGITAAPPPEPEPVSIEDEESPTDSTEIEENMTSSYDDYDEPGKGNVGAMSDILIAAGFGFNLRSGLNPTHSSGVFPCIRADLHFLMGAFTDTPFIRDLGLGGSFNMGLGLSYAASNGGDDWESSQIQWRGELIYRLALLDDTKIKPAFVLRGGYGATIATIEAPVTVADVRSVSYTAPFAGLDIYMMLADPVLRLRFGGGVIFAIAAAEELKADAFGFYVNAGVDIVVAKWLHTSLGWEMTRYSLEDKGTPTAPAMGSTDDLFNHFYVRLGFSFDGK